MTLGTYSLGDVTNAICPSMDQLEGIDNPNDPCQAISQLPISSAPSNAGNISEGATPSQLELAAAAATPTTTQWITGIPNSMLLLIGGGILFMVAIKK